MASVTQLQLADMVVALVHSWLDYGNVVLVGIPACLQRRLQSVVNAAACLIYCLGFHWLLVPERVKYKVAMLTYKGLHNTAWRYLRPLVCVVDISGRRTLRSAVTDCLPVPSVHLRTVGNVAFTVATPKIWNSLPDDIVSSANLSTFCHQLKTVLFSVSVSDLIL